MRVINISYNTENKYSLIVHDNSKYKMRIADNIGWRKPSTNQSECNLTFRNQKFISTRLQSY
jgi:hypothetical protein